MKVRIKSSDWEIVKYETVWAVAFDFRCIEDLVFKPGEFKLVETGLVVEVPEWYYLQISPRSSTFKKHWLIQTNSVWIVDRDYCWNNDTIKFPYFNLSWEKQVIDKWTRIGQWVFLKYVKAEFELVDDMSHNNDRWGFGSTWIK